MSVRRVVTGVDGEGRSMFVSDGPAFGGDQWAEIWLADPARGPGALADPRRGPTALEPPPGGIAWYVFEVPPDAVMRERMAANAAAMPAIEQDGFHTTETVDYVTVLDGEISLELDTGEVHLAPGDCVVQRRTRHAWRNRTDRPVKMMAVLVSLRET